MRQKLKSIIESRQLSIQTIADGLNVHRSMIYNHLAGRTNLGSHKAIALAKFLNISLDDVYS